MDVCLDYGYLTGDKPHPHIPLLAIRPDMQGKGIGDPIVKHLIGEAALVASSPGNHDVVFLEVYTDNAIAIRRYENNGFVKINESNPTFDENENKHYFVMTRRVSRA